MRRRKFVKYTRRHRWQTVRVYKYVTLYRCRACDKWTRRATPGALELAVRACLPKMIADIFKPSPIFAALHSRAPLAVSGGGPIQWPVTA